MTAVLLAPVVPRCCRWCDQPVKPGRLANHLRDTGDVTVCPDDACPGLFAARNTLVTT